MAEQKKSARHSQSYGGTPPSAPSELKEMMTHPLTKATSMPVREILGKNITDRRKTLGLSQKELAFSLSCTEETLCRHERGLGVPTMETLENYARFLHCKVYTLFFTEEEKYEDFAQTLQAILDTLSKEDQEDILSVIKHVVEASKV